MKTRTAILLLVIGITLNEEKWFATGGSLTMDCYCFSRDG
jgi:hypothetical protein